MSTSSNWAGTTAHLEHRHLYGMRVCMEASCSGSKANCVEVQVRDRANGSRLEDRTGRVLRFPTAAWRNFADLLKAGERDFS
jgi:hypothetical protein